MAERRSVLTEENQPTVIAVCFVLALLATGFGVYDLLQIRSLSMFVQRTNNVNVESVNTQLSTAMTRLADLERRLGDIEQRSAAAGIPVAADGGTPSPEGKAGKSKTP
jgi:hypothetical protein